MYSYHKRRSRVENGIIFHIGIYRCLILDST